jgi:ABC-2 type transport system ATP-binding protein
MDPQGALAVRTLLGALAASGVTIFLSTHSLAVAEELCDRIGILDRGRLVAMGTLEELRAQAAERPELASYAASLETVFLRLTGTGGRGR